jgi:hypothetical protein
MLVVDVVWAIAGAANPAAIAIAATSRIVITSFFITSFFSFGILDYSHLL